MSIDSTAYFLVTHGSRDPRSWAVLSELVTIAQHQTPSILISGGCLEGLPLSLAQQLQKFGQEAQDLGYQQIAIAPLFLIPGVHVTQDIPEQVAIAQQYFSALKFQVLPYLGTHPQIPHLIQSQFEQQGDHARILIAHGSRREGANQPIETLAKSTGAIAAYWSVAPSLETQIEACQQKGFEQIAVMPYFLAPGAITEAIAAKILNYRHKIKMTLMSEPLTFEQITSLAISSAIR
jgi:sirohydrochlorin cobaltochelatase